MQPITFLHYRKQFSRYFWLGLGALLLTNIFDVLPPLIIKRGLDQIQAGTTTKELFETVGILGAITAFMAFFRYHWRAQWGQYHFNAARDIREKLHQRLLELGPTFYQKKPVGELMSVLTNDVEAYRMGIGPGVLVLTDAFLYFATIPAIMLWISPSLTFKTLIFFPLLPFFINRMGGIIHKRFIVVQRNFSALSAFVQENISGIRLVKSYAQEDNQRHLLDDANEKLRHAAFQVSKADSFMQPTMNFAVATGIVILLYLAGPPLAEGTLTVGTFVAFHRYISKMAWPMRAIGWGTSLIQQGRASLARINEVLTFAPDVIDGPQTQPLELKSLQGSIRLQNVHFAYPGTERQVLKNLSLEIRQGETIGIIGPVGSGKSTLTQLLGHLYAIENGRMFFNEHEINQIPLAVLRRHITIVPQDAFLFSEKISENMAIVSESTPPVSLLEDVAHTAKLDEEIARMPMQFDTDLGERGVNLSGGQRQRMTIMRALLRQSPVIVFDDSLSAVDAATEKQILDGIQSRSKNQTTVIVSHRLTTLNRCDRVVVLREGQIEALGTPRDLMLTCNTFRELASHQGMDP